MSNRTPPPPPPPPPPPAHRTLRAFISSHIEPIPPTYTPRNIFQTITLPCALCARHTNLRVKLPTCAHAVCLTCVSEFLLYQSPVGRFVCLYCLSYWFTIEPGNEIRGMRSERKARELNEEIERTSREVWGIVNNRGQKREGGSGSWNGAKEDMLESISALVEGFLLGMVLLLATAFDSMYTMNSTMMTGPSLTRKANYIISETLYFPSRLPVKVTAPFAKPASPKMPKTSSRPPPCNHISWTEGINKFRNTCPNCRKPLFRLNRLNRLTPGATGCSYDRRGRCEDGGS
ncbi:hypothetical protein K504DRAFT_508713 [Pleomassaria siparia CBS 279.74]|uniref:RING-type domain-containing protein n=1 Tax=Pleomassaria siparia CBS 279.74 TaxID=1314801 RepID=A0A6G1JR16_9PLEO|nr:hypothetical protein K504DRAFT_508713 [Pleomassaria siparia CBS 279.74]